jgi:hypothetical protein
MGDTLASALLANDGSLVGEKFKYHRARGILTAGSEEPKCDSSVRFRCKNRTKYESDRNRAVRRS